MTTHLAAQLAHVVAQARAAGMASLDLWTLEGLLHEHQHARPDFVRAGDMLIVGLIDD
jgi:2-keto-3-deoxy-galactonokinase